MQSISVGVMKKAINTEILNEEFLDHVPDSQLVDIIAPHIDLEAATNKIKVNKIYIYAHFDFLLEFCYASPAIEGGSYTLIETRFD